MKKSALLILILLSVSCIDRHKTKIAVVETSEIKTDTIIEQPKLENDFLLGRFDYKSHPEFAKVASEFSSKTLYLQKETYAAFLKMQKAAKADGVNLTIISGSRNFAEQKAIWNRKWKRYNSLTPIERTKKILEYSSMPSTSRHHWGTDMDLNNLSNSYFASGTGKRIYGWLTKNANSYGFYQVYNDKTKGRTGYNLERWHWSYLPLASKYLTAYNSQITYQNISDFEGSEYAEQVKMIEEFVNGISIKAKNYVN